MKKFTLIKNDLKKTLRVPNKEVIIIDTTIV